MRSIEIWGNIATLAAIIGVGIALASLIPGQADPAVWAIVGIGLALGAIVLRGFFWLRAETQKIAEWEGKNISADISSQIDALAQDFKQESTRR